MTTTNQTIKCGIKQCEKAAVGGIFTDEVTTAGPVMMPRCGDHLTEPWPSKNDTYCRVTSCGEVVTLDRPGAKTEARRKFLGIFRTKEEAQERLEFIKAILPETRYQPKQGEWYRCVSSTTVNDPQNCAVIKSVRFNNDGADRFNLAIGNTFPDTTEGIAAAELYRSIIVREANKVCQQK